MKKLALIGLTALLLFVLVACSGPAATSSPEPTPEPASVLQGFMDALAAKDIDAVMSFWAEDAVQIDQFGRNVGLEEIRASHQSAIDDDVTFEVSNVTESNGRLVYDYRVFNSGVLVASGTGLTIVEDGKIVFDGTEESLAAECERDASQTFCETE
jgi:hypothetical protein